MRALSIAVLLPLLAACEAEPAPQPTPRATADPEIVKAEVDRREMFVDVAKKGDFDVRFVEPFMSLDVRGEKIGVSRAGSYKVVSAKRTRDGKTITFRADEGLNEGEEPFVLTITNRPCRDAFSGERTQLTAWLGTEGEPRRLRSCAAPAK